MAGVKKWFAVSLVLERSDGCVRRIMHTVACIKARTARKAVLKAIATYPGHAVSSSVAVKIAGPVYL